MDRINRFIPARTAAKILIVIFGVLVIFHVLMLLQLLPPNMVWGGQAAGSPASLRTLEVISLIITILFTLVVAAKAGFIQAAGWVKVVNVLLWLIFVYLLLNTLGNLASGSSLERAIFAPLSIIAMLLVFRLAMEK